jgi:hypothetical protein
MPSSVKRHLNSHHVRLHVNLPSPLDIPRCLWGLRPKLRVRETSIPMKQIVLDLAYMIEEMGSVESLQQLQGRNCLPEGETLRSVRVVGLTQKLFGSPMASQCCKSAARTTGTFSPSGRGHCRWTCASGWRRSLTAAVRRRRTARAMRIPALLGCRYGK